MLPYCIVGGQTSLGVAVGVGLGVAVGAGLGVEEARGVPVGGVVPAWIMPIVALEVGVAAPVVAVEVVLADGSLFWVKVVSCCPWCPVMKARKGEIVLNATISRAARTSATGKIVARARADILRFTWSIERAGGRSEDGSLYAV